MQKLSCIQTSQSILDEVLLSRRVKFCYRLFGSSFYLLKLGVFRCFSNTEADSKEASSSTIAGMANSGTAGAGVEVGVAVAVGEVEEVGEDVGVDDDGGKITQ
jgi:hypothetical protein